MTIKVHVSDHALLRFIERYYQVDIEKIRSNIEAAAYPAAKLGAASFAVENITLCMRRDTVRENLVTVATVLERGMKLHNQKEHAQKKNRRKERQQ